MGSLASFIAVALLIIANQRCQCHDLRHRHITSEDSAQPTPVHSSNEDCSLYANVSQPVLTLFSATAKNNVSAVRCLIATGMNVSGTVMGGFTALHEAASVGSMPILRMLIQAGADLNVHDSVVGLTPLHTAAGKNFVEAVALLINSGANVNAKSIMQVSPLQVAVTMGHENIVRLMIEKGADVNARDNLGNTALHVAAYRGYLPIVQLLVQKGANVNATNTFALKPVDLASAHEDVKVWLNSKRR